MVSSWVEASYRLGALAALGCLTACGPSPNAHDDPAAWDVAPHQELSPHSTGFTAVVTRTDCSSGKQGTPVAPVIDAGASTITITFRIAPHISGGTCEGTAGVAYRVTPELVRMAEDYAAERRAAGRTVPDLDPIFSLGARSA